LTTTGGVGSVAAAATIFGVSLTTEAKTADVAAPVTYSRSRRAEQAFSVRQRAALKQRNLPLPNQLNNGDEELYENKVGSYTKGLPHNSVGEVDLSSYQDLDSALRSGHPLDFEKITLGSFKKLANPQAALAFVLEGPDSHCLRLTPPPTFGSAEIASEMAEMYWQALARDVPFSEYESNSLTNAAASDLSGFSSFRGSKVGGRVSTETLFRGDVPGCLTGPYISQFLSKDIQYGAIPIVQRIRTSPAGLDYMFTYARWLAVQNGDVAGANPYEITPRYLLDPVLRYIHSGRSLAEYVHRDFTYQAFLNACLILFSLEAPFDRGNPYRKSRTQVGFTTFGEAHLFDIVAKVANCALKVAWYQKWMWHRRLRPEEFGGRVHLHRSGIAKYPLHDEILNSPVLDKVHSKNGTYLLAQVYPEGCPLHPSYPAGHAIIAGACATVVKAFFNESFVIREPVVASSDGLKLEPYSGPDLTVGGELNKLAFNIAFGRDMAGVHWRSDGMEGIKLGEAVALALLADMKECHNENFAGFLLTKFDGTNINV
jgi:membrane-associated phospholipid phosphatase